MSGGAENQALKEDPMKSERARRIPLAFFLGIDLPSPSEGVKKLGRKKKRSDGHVQGSKKFPCHNEALIPF
jgi:hypothetical protein